MGGNHQADTIHKTEKDLVPLIDCDILQYRCGFAADAQMKKEFKEANPVGTNEELEQYLADRDYIGIALQNVKTVLEKVTDRFNDQYIAYIQDGRHFRYDLATIKPYKGNRDTTHKPKYYTEIKEYILDQWGAVPVRGIESDDAIGIEQFKRTDKYSVIVSSDKDMLSIPGWHFDWTKDILHYQTINEANLFHFYQMLTGDTVDNIQGIRGIGPKKAGQLIERNGRELGRVRQEVQSIYQQTYGPEWERYYQEVSRLLYILRRYEHKETGCPFLYG